MKWVIEIGIVICIEINTDFINIFKGVSSEELVI
jgi:hypothetical protein